MLFNKYDKLPQKTRYELSPKPTTRQRTSLEEETAFASFSILFLTSFVVAACFRWSWFLLLCGILITTEWINCFTSSHTQKVDARVSLEAEKKSCPSRWIHFCQTWWFKDVRNRSIQHLTMWPCMCETKGMLCLLHKGIFFIIWRCIAHFIPFETALFLQGEKTTPMLLDTPTTTLFSPFLKSALYSTLAKLYLPF